MFLRGILFLLGITLTVIGLTNIILYLNLLVNGYTFLEYVNFIIRRIECLNFVFGVIFMIISTFIGGKENELYLWYNIKF